MRSSLARAVACMLSTVDSRKRMLAGDRKRLILCRSQITGKGATVKAHTKLSPMARTLNILPSFVGAENLMQKFEYRGLD